MTPTNEERTTEERLESLEKLTHTQTVLLTQMTTNIVELYQRTRILLALLEHLFEEQKTEMPLKDDKNVFSA